MVEEFTTKDNVNKKENLGSIVWDMVISFVSALK